MPKQLVTILIPNYKTLDLTKLCLRLIRKYTDLNKAKIIVIDNDSKDASTEYLRTLQWITLIERKAIPGEGGVQSHSSALDLALETVETPYVLSIHTDTLVKNSEWLEFLLDHMERDKNIAGVGSWKLESKPLIKQILKKCERSVQAFFYGMIGRSNHTLEGVGKNYYYLRSHCAMYRMELLRKYNLKFSDGDGLAGKEMHKQLLLHNHQMLFLPSDILIPYLDHINHATSVLNPELSTRSKSVKKGLRRVQNNLAKIGADEIMQAHYLDN